MVVVVGSSCCWSLLLEMAEPAAGDGCCWRWLLLEPKTFMVEPKPEIWVSVPQT